MTNKIEAEVVTRLGQSVAAIDSVNKALDRTAQKTSDINKKAKDQDKGWSASGKAGVAALAAIAAAAGKVLESLDAIEKKRAQVFSEKGQQVGNLRQSVRGLVGQEAASRVTESLLSRNVGLTHAQIASFIGSFDAVGIDGVSEGQLKKSFQAFSMAAPVIGGSGSDIAALSDLMPDLSAEQTAALGVELGSRGGLDSSTTKQVRQFQAGGMDPMQAIALALAFKRAQVSGQETKGIAKELMAGKSLQQLLAGKGSAGSQLALRQVDQIFPGGVAGVEASVGELQSAVTNGPARLQRELSDDLMMRMRTVAMGNRQLEERNERIFMNGRAMDDFLYQRGAELHQLDQEDKGAYFAARDAFFRSILPDALFNKLEELKTGVDMEDRVQKPQQVEIIRNRDAPIDGGQ